MLKVDSRGHSPNTMPVRRNRGGGAVLLRRGAGIWSSPPSCFRSARRGQALLIAVLVLFALASLAALFAAIIGSQIAHVGRHSDMVALRNISEAGLNYANEQLTYGVDGADWRPGVWLPDGTLDNRWYRCGRGQFRLTVDYGPEPAQLQSRFVRVVCTARFPDDPFVRHTVLALKPLLLTDYGRFITDRFDTARAAALGCPGVELGGMSRDGYLLEMSGPLRSNTDLVWHGNSRLDLYNSSATVPGGGATWASLGVLRDDRVEIAGQLLPADTGSNLHQSLSLGVNGVLRISNVFWPTAAQERQDYVYGFPDWIGAVGGLARPNTQRVLADLPQIGTFPEELYAQYLSTPRVRPPDIDATNPDLQTKRYWALTRDSGAWTQPAGGSWLNPGAFGWGWTNSGGIYIDNTSDIQYQHDLEKLRLNWTGSMGTHQTVAPTGDRRTDAEGPLAGPADWWDKTGRYYGPPGVEIILHGETKCPYIEVIRHDPKMDGGTGGVYYWQTPDGAPILPVDGVVDYTHTPLPGQCQPMVWHPTVDASRAIFPFPPNGVIYAEGNVRIKGIMPPVRHNPQGYFDNDWTTNEGFGRSRRYDLSVVSAGTIYVEGDLLTPKGARIRIPGTSDVIDTVQEDLQYGSRIALLARDYVCVNTTALNPRPANLFGIDADNNVYNDGYETYPPGGYNKSIRLRGPTSADRPDLYTSAGIEDWAENSAPISTIPGLLDFRYENVRLWSTREQDLRSQIPDLRLLLGHSGWYDPYSLDPQDANWPHAGARVQVRLGTRRDIYPYPAEVRYWEQGTDEEYYSFLRPPANGAANQSGHWYADGVDMLEFLPDDYQWMMMHDPDPALTDALPPLLTGTDTIRLETTVLPVSEKLADDSYVWVVRPEELAYIAGPMAVTPPRVDAPLPVRIEAMVYAQDGSWFIIPGPWFNEDPDEGDYTRQYPGYHEPLNMQIQFYGAITENMPAPLGAASEWTSKWAGPEGVASLGFLKYEYDPLLRWSGVRDSAGRSYARFPKLPMTPDLLIWGERIEGQAGP